jgi:hypothetical protein
LIIYQVLGVERSAAVIGFSDDLGRGDQLL